MSNEDVMRVWYNRAQIDYVRNYMSLYAAFNGWYRVKTGKENDREALNILRKGEPLWSAYCNGDAMHQLKDFMILLVELTQREPISHPTPHWNGEMGSIKDWCSLIEYWYRVRCLVMHGAPIQSHYVYLAYETLNIFMTEVLKPTNNYQNAVK